MEEKFVLLACFICSVTGLILIYFSSKNFEPYEIELSEISPELIGRAVRSKGKIVYKKIHPSGHLFLTLEEKGSRIQVPIFSGLMSRINENGIEEEDFSLGRILEVSGVVDEYQGQLQIIPRKIEDIRLG